MKKLDTLTILAASFVLYGCSGHTLQNLTDKAFDQKTQTQPAVTSSPSQNKTLSAISPDSTQNIPEKTNAAPTQKKVIEPSGNRSADTVSKMDSQNLQQNSSQRTATTNKVQQVQTQTSTTVSPAQNKALYAVSPSNQKAPDGFMQNSYKKWVKKEWAPTVEQNATIKQRDANKSRPFKLQDYVDKAEYYLSRQPKSKQPSNVEKMDKLPVIGN
jgi:hypothetical protein